MATEAQFKQLDELIYDEEKIITLMTIGNELNLSSEQGRDILSSYIKEKLKTDRDNLQIVHVINGISENKQAIKLVTAKDLQEIKGSFEKIFSEFVFSIHKGKSTDLDAIASINQTSGNIVGIRPCENFTKRSNVKPVTPNCSNRDSVKKEIKTEGATKANKKTNGISVFLKKTSPTVKQEVPIQTQKRVEKTCKGLSGYVPKNPLKIGDLIQNMSKEGAKILQKEDEPKEVPNEQMEIDNDSDAKVAQNKKRKRARQMISVPNKKRLQRICDSDSSDIFEDNDSVDIIEKSDDDEKPVFIPKPVEPKNKTRRAVEKSFLDEEGYMVTTTEYVFDSLSEEEMKPIAAVPEEKKPVKPTQTVKGSSGKGKANKKVDSKQTTLMNFFKKS